MKYSLLSLYATLLTVPFALRKVIWHEEGGYFGEYNDISLYFFEIFILCYIVASILEHRVYIKSMYSKVFHVEHILLTLLFSLSTVTFALYESSYFSLILLLKWFLYICFGIVFYKHLKKIVPRGTIKKKYSSTWNNLSKIILTALIIQSFIIIGQLIHQNSIGFYFLGESVINTKISGVATIIIKNQEFLRGYGTFLHPNQAAFFFFCYLLVFLLINNVPRGTIYGTNFEKCSTWNIIWHKFGKMFHVEQYMAQISKNVPRGTIFFLYLLILTAFLGTFSKAILLLSVLLQLFSIYLYCSTWNNWKISEHSKELFHVEQYVAKIWKNVPRGTIAILGIIMIFGSVFLFKQPFIQQSILERKLQYLSIPYENVTSLLRGYGLGSYVEKLAEKSPGLYYWQYQPVHNSFILAVFELGLVPFLVLSLYIWRKLKSTSFIIKQISKVQSMIILIFICIFILLNTDHYMWDLEQTQFLGIILVTILWFFFCRDLPQVSKNTKRGIIKICESEMPKHKRID